MVPELFSHFTQVIACAGEMVSVLYTFGLRRESDASMVWIIAELAFEDSMMEVIVADVRRVNTKAVDERCGLYNIFILKRI